MKIVKKKKSYYDDVTKIIYMRERTCTFSTDNILIILLLNRHIVEILFREGWKKIVYLPTRNQYTLSNTVFSF